LACSIFRTALSDKNCRAYCVVAKWNSDGPLDQNRLIFPIRISCTDSPRSTEQASSSRQGQSDFDPRALYLPMREHKDFHLRQQSLSIAVRLEFWRLVMASATDTSIKRTIRRQQLRAMVPLADSTIYEMEQRGEFPRRFALSPRCVVWDLAEIEAWLAGRRSAPIARAPSPDVRQRRSRPVREPGPGRISASKAG
jgi:prophage regulatory protein